jgi:phosphatidylethanolamine/phosphatidyl-N-methylethanolamine N-methyltransferase
MPNEYRVFFQQFIENYHSTGAIAPSGRWLAAALSRQLDQTAGQGRAREILEVGPGTGAVTGALVRRLQAGDTLTLVELNEKFVEHLQRRFRDEEAFRQVAGQTRILHQAVEELPDASRFDHVVSGLPLNNFDVDVVERILGTFERLMAPGGTLSFFEYMGVRRLRGAVGPRADRARLTGISQALGALLERHGSARDWVWPNLPPAWVHHLKKNAEFRMANGE